MVRRTPRRKQPGPGVGIKWSNPITRNLDCAINPGAGMIDLVNNKIQTTYGATPAFTKDEYGVSIDNRVTGAGGYNTALERNLAIVSTTHLCIFRSDYTTNGGSAGVFGVSNGSGSDNAFMMQAHGSTAANMVIYQNGSSDMGMAANVVIPLSVIVIQTATNSSIVGERGTRFWVNGRLVTYVSAEPKLHSSSRICLLGERTGTTTYSYRGQIYLYLGWSRFLGVEEITALYQNLYGMIFKDDIEIQPDVATSMIAAMQGANYEAIAYLNSVAKASVGNISSIIV